MAPLDALVTGVGIGVDVDRFVAGSVPEGRHESSPALQRREPKSETHESRRADRNPSAVFDRMAAYKIPDFTKSGILRTPLRKIFHSLEAAPVPHTWPSVRRVILFAAGRVVCVPCPEIDAAR